jgi:hypothetical protein
MPANVLKRRVLLAAAVASSVSAISYVFLRKVGLQSPEQEVQTSQKSAVETANEAFFRGDYRVALQSFMTLANKHDDGAAEFLHAAALCHFHLNEWNEANLLLEKLTQKSLDDWYLTTLVRANNRKFNDALSAFEQLPPADAIADIPLCKTMALASVEANNRAQAWRFYRYVQHQDPSSPELDKLQQTGQFDFRADFFGYGPDSLLNYTKGFGGGALDWGIDSVKGLWQLVRHPIDSVTAMAKVVSEICTKENLSLLLSPRELATALGDTAARVYWSAWDACKASAVREYRLDAEDFASQRMIHEIAAGRMIGYVAPELVLLVLSAGVGTAAKVSKAERAVEITKAVGQTEQRLEKVNAIGRSTRFLKDVEQFPLLRRIPWLSEPMWETLKMSPRLSGRLERVVAWMHDVRHIPGAEDLLRSISSRLHLDDVEGYLFQLERAATHARDGKLAEIGRKFHVDVALPGKPVGRILGDADLVLRDGTLVETKLRNAPLALDQSFHKQLLKYDRAVQEGQFKGIRIESNTKVSQAVKDRCNVLASRGTPIEIVEDLRSRA